MWNRAAARREAARCLALRFPKPAAGPQYPGRAAGHDAARGEDTSARALRDSPDCPISDADAIAGQVSISMTDPGQRA